MQELHAEDDKAKQDLEASIYITYNKSLGTGSNRQDKSNVVPSMHKCGSRSHKIDILYRASRCFRAATNEKLEIYQQCYICFMRILQLKSHGKPLRLM